MSDPDHPQLPELHNAVLDEATLGALFDDLASCTEILAVIPKHGPGRAPESGIPLAEARAGFLAGDIRALQIRYQYDGDEWWDTLMQTPDGARVVRIKQEF